MKKLLLTTTLVLTLAACAHSGQQHYHKHTHKAPKVTTYQCHQGKLDVIFQEHRDYAVVAYNNQLHVMEEYPTASGWGYREAATGIELQGKAEQASLYKGDTVLAHACKVVK